jgi:hypothetical protein
MSDLRTAAQQALEALEFMADEWGFTQKANRPERWQAITALKAALKQPEQGGKTGWPPGLLQDDCRGLSKWLASQPDARRRVREAVAALEQTEQEPLAIATVNESLGVVFKFSRSHTLLPGQMLYVYTHPPRREWRNLTIQEINALPEVGGRMWNMGVADAVLRAIRAIEAKLKELNHHA